MTFSSHEKSKMFLTSGELDSPQPTAVPWDGQRPVRRTCPRSGWESLARKGQSRTLGPFPLPSSMIQGRVLGLGVPAAPRQHVSGSDSGRQPSPEAPTRAELTALSTCLTSDDAH